MKDYIEEKLKEVVESFTDEDDAMRVNKWDTTHFEDVVKQALTDTKNETLRGVLEWAESNTVRYGDFEDIPAVILDDLKDHIKKELHD